MRETSSGSQDVRCLLDVSPAVIAHTASAKVLAALPVTCDLLTPRLSKQKRVFREFPDRNDITWLKSLYMTVLFPTLGSLTVLRCMFKTFRTFSIKNITHTQTLLSFPDTGFSLT